MSVHYNRHGDEGPGVTYGKGDSLARTVRKLLRDKHASLFLNERKILEGALEQHDKAIKAREAVAADRKVRGLQP